MGHLGLAWWSKHGSTEDPGCIERQSDIASMVYGRASSETEWALREHLSGCRRCRRQLRAFTDLVSAHAESPGAPLPARRLRRIVRRLAAASQGS